MVDATAVKNMDTKVQIVEQKTGKMTKEFNVHQRQEVQW